MVRKSYGRDCPVARSLDILGERWTLLIIGELLEGEARFSELSLRLSGIPSNLLASRLRFLEQAGLVRRAPYSRRPLRVRYQLTEAGQAVDGVIKALHEWGITYATSGYSRGGLADRTRTARRSPPAPESLSA